MEAAMMQQRRMKLVLVAALGMFPALLLTSNALASDQGKLAEEFHQVYSLSANGRIALDNVNGPVHIAAWDRNEVKVEAIKRAWTKERLDEAKIEISAQADSISIRTQYPEHDHNFNDDGRGNPASVEYTLTVPRQARLDDINLVNGSLDVKDVAGEIHASCVNGRLEARNLMGRTQLSTVNGELDASVDQMPSSSLELSAVNGGLRVTLPSDAKARVEASTVSGGISNDFGLPVSRHLVGRSLHGELGGGGTDVKLSNVNGRIEIRHANDNRPMSPAKSLDHDRNRDDDDGDSI